LHKGHVVGISGQKIMYATVKVPVPVLHKSGKINIIQL